MDSISHTFASKKRVLLIFFFLVLFVGGGVIYFIQTTSSSDAHSVTTKTCTTTAGKCTTTAGKCTTTAGKCTTTAGKCTTTAGKCTTVKGKCTTVKGKCTTVKGKCTTTPRRCVRTYYDPYNCPCQTCTTVCDPYADPLDPGACTKTCSTTPGGCACGKVAYNESCTGPTTTCAPDTTTCAPDTTTCAPDTTTCAPDTTTCAPDTTTCAPDTTTCAPDTTTCAPDTKICVDTNVPHSHPPPPPSPPVNKCAGVSCCQGKTCNSNTGLCEGTCTVVRVSPSCKWTDTGTTRDNKTCTNTSTARIQKQKEQKCGPTDCRGKCGTKNRGSTQWVNSGSAVTQTCTGQCTNGECPAPPECRWQDTGNTKNICQNKTTTKQQTQEQCGPTDCIDGSCTKGEYRWIDTTPLQTTTCTSDKVCKLGACITPPTCTWQQTTTTQTICTNKTQTRTQTEYICGPDTCIGGTCTRGTTEWRNTGTPLTCTQGKICKLGSCTSCTTNTDCPTNQTCTNGACIAPTCTETTQTTITCQDTDTILTTIETTCTPTGCQGGSCTPKTQTSTADCPNNEVCGKSSRRGSNVECLPQCSWTDTGETRTNNTCTTTTTQTTQQQKEQECGPNNCIGTCSTNKNKGETQWVNVGTATTRICPQGETCPDTICLPTCRWIEWVDTKTSLCLGPTILYQNRTQVCGPGSCIGTSICVKGSRKGIGGQIIRCPNGCDYQTKKCIELCKWEQDTTTTCQDKTTILTTTTKTCGPTNCQYGTCTEGTTQTPTTTTTSCQEGQVCKEGVCTSCIINTDCPTNQTCTNGSCTDSLCKWIDTSTQQVQRTCTNGTTIQEQTQTQQECGPSDCTETTATCTKGDTQLVDTGTPTIQACTNNKICTSGACIDPPECSWQQTATTQTICTNKTQTQIQTEYLCGPTNCQAGVCTQGTTEWRDTGTPTTCINNQVCKNQACNPCITNTECPTGKICTSGACIDPPECSWQQTATTQTICTNKTQTQIQTEYLCGPTNCQAGVCTQGTTEWRDTGTPTTCINNQVCKNQACNPCITNTECPTGKICTSGACIDPPQCKWTDTGDTQKNKCTTNKKAIQNEKEQVCGPTNCVGTCIDKDGTTVNKGTEQWINSTLTLCNPGLVCTPGTTAICAAPLCKWIDTTESKERKVCISNTEQGIQNQERTKKVCGPTNCAGTCTKSDGTTVNQGGIEHTSWTDKGAPTSTTPRTLCSTNQSCNTSSGLCETNIQCNWIQGTQTKSCDTNNNKQINIQTQQVCGPPGCTPLQGGCTQGQTQSPTTTTQLCQNNQVCHNGSCIIPQPPTLQNNRLDTSITHKETSCRTEQRFTWTPLFNNGATQKTYHLQVATERRFFREYDNASNANQRKTAQDKLTVNFKPRNASSNVRSIPILTTQQTNKLLFNEIDNRGNYQSGHNRTYYARVRVQDSNNQWSSPQWSTIQSFTTPDYPGPRLTIQIPSFVPLGRTFITTGIIESQHTQQDNLSYEWNIFQKQTDAQNRVTTTDVTHNVIQLPITDPPTTIDQEKTKESIQLSLPQETEYTITLTTTDNPLSSHNNTCITTQDITPGNNQQTFPTYREVPATTE